MIRPRPSLLVLALVAIPRLARAQDDEAALLKEIQDLQGSSGPASEVTLRQLVDSTLPQVSKVMGLTAPASVKMKVVTRAEARTKLLELLRRDYPGDTLSHLGDLLAAVGLADPGKDLTAEATTLYSQNVSGFYDPHERVLFLLADQPLEAQAMIVAHELAHAVQDEHLGLDAASRERRGSEDAQLAFSAAIEGQAQEVTSQVMASQLTEAGLEFDGVADLLSEGTASSAGQAASQASTPWLGLQLSFPYIAGAHLISALKRPDDRTARSVLRRLPESTAQVLAPELYQRNEHPVPGAIHLANALVGSTPVYGTTLGRANLDLFGQLHGSGNLGEGWRGDRAEAVRLNGRVVAVWSVSFSSAAQADRLVKAWTAALHATAGAKTVQSDGAWYVVQGSGVTAVMLEGVPDSQSPAVEKAALAAFGGSVSPQP